MKIAILSRYGVSFIPVMADGLNRMLTILGVDSKVYNIGDYLLSSNIDCVFRERSRFKAAVLRAISGTLLRLVNGDLLKFDALIFVNTAPTAFLRNRYTAIETWVRHKAPHIPIILYSPEYHAANNWFAWLKKGNDLRNIPQGQWGLERFDWYLCPRLMNIFPLPEGRNPVTEIGLHLDDGSLYVESRNTFCALIDFYRDINKDIRQIQKQALLELKIPYVELRGKYKLKDIRAIYRKTSIYFTSFYESFGIPICETQACGNYVFTAFNRWCSSHWLSRSEESPGVFKGKLNMNFMEYKRSKNTLKELINEVKETYNPRLVRERFLSDHRELYYGNLSHLEEFISLLNSGVIHGGSHRNWKNIVSNDFNMRESPDFYYYD